MIILDEEEEQLPKIASPPPVHPVVRRPSTPTPSLPDYETSQEEESRKVLSKYRGLSRRWKWSIYGLIAYFVVTIAIGVPLIVVKTRQGGKSYTSPSMFYPSPAFGGNSTSLAGFNLGAMPICVEDATACDAWDFKDRQEGGLLRANLQYSMPVEGMVFVQSNVSCLQSKAGPITGSLTVSTSPNPQDTNATVKVYMSYTGTHVRERTSVCLMNLYGSDGLYIYVPQDLYAPDHLDFNITMLLPRSNGTKPLYINNLLTSLPFFNQHITAVSPRTSFGTVVLSGVHSNVTVDSLQAEGIAIKTPYAKISGMFNITDDDSTDGGDDNS